MFYVIWRT